jgi:hypothetical protein
VLTGFVAGTAREQDDFSERRIGRFSFNGQPPLFFSEFSARCGEMEQR